MTSQNRRATARRRAWGRGPKILRFEPLEGRQLLAITGAAVGPDLVATAFSTLHNLDWGDPFRAVGTIENQGNADAPKEFRVDVYASTGPVIGPGSVRLGSITVPAGLAPGETYPFDEILNLPTGPLPGQGASPLVWLGLRVDPERAVPDINRANNEGRGQGYDQSVVTITPRTTAELQGVSFGVFPDRAAWGSTVTIAAQVRNHSQGDAPPTQARVVLTPHGRSLGGSSDVTIGRIDVPAVPAWQTVSVMQTLTLPAGPPSAFRHLSRFTLAMIQDADFVADPTAARSPTQGLGRDLAEVILLPGPNAEVPQGPRPDLAVAGVQAPSLPLAWGQPFQVATTIQNVGGADAENIRVRFLLTGLDGSTQNALHLADATLSDLKAGFAQEIIQTVRAPVRLPNGQLASGSSLSRIVVVVDPENTLDELSTSNNAAASSPIVLRVVGQDGRSTPVLPTQPVPPSGPSTPPSATPNPTAPAPTPPNPTSPAPRPGPGPGPVPGMPRPAGQIRVDPGQQAPAPRPHLPAPMPERRPPFVPRLRPQPPHLRVLPDSRPTPPPLHGPGPSHPA